MRKFDMLGENPEAAEKLRVAAYCRVSTDRDDQANSLASQQRYFNDCIRRNPLWELAEIYVDEGVTGTSTKKRQGFLRMLADAQRHAFDLLLTKEISRFARNTLDSILYTRKLRELGVGVLFLNDNIDTLDPDAELRLAIMSSIAQEESRKTSERVKWGQRRRMEQGIVFGRSMLGYDVKNGAMTVNEEGAQVVRLIFHRFLEEGKGAHTIARELREAGIATYRGMKDWSSASVLRILRNEKYCGDLVQKKTITPNYLNHEKKYNHGEEPVVVLRDHHTPIVSRELFERAQAELARRRPAKEQPARHTCRYCFSGKLNCGYCGSTFVSRTKKQSDGSVYRCWRCGEAARHGRLRTNAAGVATGCDGRQIGDGDLMELLSQVVKTLPLSRERMLGQLVETLRAVLGQEPPEAAAGKIRQKICRLAGKRQRLIDLYLSRQITEGDFERLKQAYEAEQGGLEREELQMRQEQGRDRERLEEIAALLEKMMAGEARDAVFYRGLLDKITIYDKGSMKLFLCCVPAPWDCGLEEL